MIFKGLVNAHRRARIDDAELGKGVWRRSYDHFQRALDRFHQMLEGIEADSAKADRARPTRSGITQLGTSQLGSAQPDTSMADVYVALIPTADALAQLLPVVRAIAQQAQRIAPSEGMEIPVGTGGYLNDVHRELTQAGNALATAAQAVALVRLGAGQLSGVERKAEIVLQHVNAARERLEKR